MKTVSNIQVLRGLSATAVLVAHAAGMLIYGDVSVLLPNVEWGAFGVDIFFVISGFVISWTAVGKFGNSKSVSRFIWHRIVRLVPLYWFATLTFSGLLAINISSAKSMRVMEIDALRSMLFIPTADGDTSILPTGWTLFYEMAFYMCFACVLPFRRRPALVGLTIALVALASAGKAGWLPARISCVANLQMLEFVAGLAIAEARMAGWRVGRTVGLAISLVTIVYVVAKAPLLSDWTDWRGLTWGMPAALIVGSLALAPDGGPRSFVRDILERLGDASYSIYLVHFPLFWAIGLGFGWFARSGPHAAQVYVLLLIMIGLPVSFGVHRLIEVPLTQWLRRIGPVPLTRIAAINPAE